MTTETESKILDCGHPEDAGSPATVIGNDGIARTVQGWRFVLDGERRICHACANLRILDCGHAPSPHESFTTGYCTDSATGATFCYACAADRDRADMIASGRATLYMVEGGQGKIGLTSVTNWPCSLTFPIGTVRTSPHNIAGRRYDAWFIGPDGWEWHAVRYGDNTQIAHCRRVTSRRADGRRISKGEVRPS